MKRPGLFLSKHKDARVGKINLYRNEENKFGFLWQNLPSELCKHCFRWFTPRGIILHRIAVKKRKEQVPVEK